MSALNLRFPLVVLGFVALGAAGCGGSVTSTADRDPDAQSANSSSGSSGSAGSSGATESGSPSETGSDSSEDATLADGAIDGSDGSSTSTGCIEPDGGWHPYPATFSLPTNLVDDAHCGTAGGGACLDCTARGQTCLFYAGVDGPDCVSAGSGSSSSSGGSSGGCVPKTCQSLGYSCGLNGDTCGGTIDCGSCDGGQFCGGGGFSKCGGNVAPPADSGAPPTCTTGCCPLTCADYPSNTCGVQSDGCGSLTTQCGITDAGLCPAGEFCGGGGPGLCGSGSDGG